MASIGKECSLRTQWCVDSGAGNTMGHCREDFEDFRPLEGTVTGIGEFELPIRGCGTVRLKCQTRAGTVVEMCLRDVYYVPDLGVNLLSVTHLLRTGAELTVSLDGWYIKKQNHTFIAKRFGNLFVLQTVSTPLPALIAYSVDPKWKQWHERMAHLGQKSLERMPEMVDGMDEAQNFCLCEACLQGRMRELPHKGTLPKGEYVGDVIHADMCGPFHITGFRGERYWITLLDGFSRLSGSVAVKTKKDAWLFVRKFALMLENQDPLRRRCRRIHTDRGGEFQDSDFAQWAAGHC